jgi:archaemetzincin
VSTIYLLPLGNADRDIVGDLRRPLVEAFQATVEVQEFDVDLGMFYDEHRVQFNSTEIIHFLHQSASPISGRGAKGHSSSKLLAVLSEDLFIPILTYVFGEAELGGCVAVVSYHRLLNERYGLPPDTALFHERLRKEALHELGHAYGLLHCSLRECVMHASSYVEDIDSKGGFFCLLCQTELHRTRRKRGSPGAAGLLSSS